MVCEKRVTKAYKGNICNTSAVNKHGLIRWVERHQLSPANQDKVIKRTEHATVRNKKNTDFLFLSKKFLM